MKKNKQNPIYWAICFITIVAIIASCLTTDNLLLFWGSFVWGISTLLAVTYSVHENWKQQSAILKKDIQVRLFDKRYSVFNALAEARLYINSQDTPLVMFSGVLESYEIKRKIYDYNENLKEKARLSQTLFNESIVKKMFKLSEYYQKVFSCYMKLNVAGSSFKPEDIQPFIGQLESLRNSALSNSDYDLSTFNKIIPNYDKVMSEWLEANKVFNQYYEECGILNDFDEYLKGIDKLD